jgi:hypothetical protein
MCFSPPHLVTILLAHRCQGLPVRCQMSDAMQLPMSMLWVFLGFRRRNVY